MTIAYWCVLVAAILPYVWTGIAKMSSGYGRKANKAPRTWQEDLAGLHADRDASIMEAAHTKVGWEACEHMATNEQKPGIRRPGSTRTQAWVVLLLPKSGFSASAR